MSVKDVSLDQGGRVRVSWTPSLTRTPIRSLRRRLVPRLAPGASRGGAARRSRAARSDRVITTREAGTFRRRGHVLGDGGQCRSRARRRATWSSPPRATPWRPGIRACLAWSRAVRCVGRLLGLRARLQGYSVDNLPPAMPAPFRFERRQHAPPWGPNHEADFLTYRLYRGASAGFTRSAQFALRRSPITGWRRSSGQLVLQADRGGRARQPDLVAMVSPPARSAWATMCRSRCRSRCRPQPGARRRAAAARAAARDARAWRCDAAGRLVRTLHRRRARSGRARTRGTDVTGRRAVERRLYFARLTAGGETRTLRLVKL